MADRGFPIVTLGATAVPVFGNTLTTVVNPSPDPHTGNFNPASQRSVGSGTVSTVLFQKGDRVLVGTAAQLASGTADSASISAVNTAGTLLTFQGLTRQHAIGEFVVLVLTCASRSIQFVNAGASQFYVGTDSTVANGLTCTTLLQIIAGGALGWGQSSIANVYDTQSLWISGASGATFLPSALTV